MRAGLSLPEPVAGRAERGPQPLRAPLARFADDYHATGRFGAALDRLKDELADPTADRVVEALRLAREVGGSELGPTLRILSGFLRDELRVRKDLGAGRYPGRSGSDSRTFPAHGERSSAAGSPVMVGTARS